MKNLVIYTFLLVFLTSSCKSKKDVAELTPEKTGQMTVTDNTPPKAKFRPGMGSGNIDDMIAQLGLSEEKAASFKAIADKYQQKRMVLKDQAKEDPQGMVQKMRNMRDAEDEEVQNLLSKKEWTKYQEILSSRSRNRKGKGGGTNGPRGGQ
jgi:hypothetical protein